VRLLDFLDAVERRIDVAVAHEQFHSTQRELLQRAVSWYRPVFAANPTSNPIALLYLLARAWGREIDHQVECAGVFCSLYLLSADLLDDVQDGELATKSHAATSSAIAINNAVTLLFLGLEALEQCVELEGSPVRREELWRLFNHASKAAVSGQHLDLVGRIDDMTPDQVLMLAQAKTSSVAMVTECAALLARCEAAEVARFRQVGESMAKLVQIRDDLVDIYGKSNSPDLAARKVTYPVACYNINANSAEREHFAQLLQRLPESLRDIRELLYEQGAVESCASRMEQLRVEIHYAVAATANHSAYLRGLLELVDRLADSVYEPVDVEATTRPFVTQSVGYNRIGEELMRCMGRLSGMVSVAPPQHRPWHLPQWMYCSGNQTIYYPDIDGLAEEVLPFQAKLLGLDDLSDVARVMLGQLPAVVAHETFHYLRHVSGNMTSDHWYEEWAANRLSVAYLRQYEPATLERSLELAATILGRYPRMLDARAEKTLERCFAQRIVAGEGYDMDSTSMAIASLEMIRRLAEQSINLEVAFKELLTRVVPSARATAA